MALALLVVLTAVVGGCKREDRGFRVRPPSAVATGGANAVTLTDFYAGATPPPGHQPVVNEYEKNAFGMSEGKRMYERMNCVGCHSHGGGGMGPPLMDEAWIYGSAPEQVYATIIQGRPNGMPSFRGKIADKDVWQIVAYVRSMSGLTSHDAANSRSDHMNVKKPEHSESTSNPQQSTNPSLQP